VATAPRPIPLIYADPVAQDSVADVEHRSDASSSSDVVVVESADDLADELRTMPMAVAEAIQVAPSIGPSTIATRRVGDARVGRLTFGIPVQTSLEMPGSTGIVTAPLHLPGEPTRWSGTEIRPGHIGAVGPRRCSEALTPAGTDALMVFFSSSALVETGHRLGLDADPARLCGPLPRTRDVVQSIDRLAAVVAGDDDSSSAVDVDIEVERLLDGLAYAATDPDLREDRGRLPFHISERIVAAAVELADAHPHRPPTMTQMCTVTGKSERRVRDAFYQVKGMPPSTYFQLRSLTRARRVLTAASPEDDTVTDIAYRLGFIHLGRFSLRYRRAFGESPVRTLRRR